MCILFRRALCLAVVAVLVLGTAPEAQAKSIWKKIGAEIRRVEKRVEKEAERVTEKVEKEIKRVPDNLKKHPEYIGIAIEVIKTIFGGGSGTGVGGGR